MAKETNSAEQLIKLVYNGSGFNRPVALPLSELTIFRTGGIYVVPLLDANQLLQNPDFEIVPEEPVTPVVEPVVEAPKAVQTQTADAAPTADKASPAKTDKV